MDKDNEVVYLKIEDIIPNKFQPREIFDETGLDELSDSIKEHGVIQPVIVRPMGDKYELIAGERRCKASSLAGLTTIPAIVREMDDRESAKVSLLENLQRKNLSPIEEARTYKRILELDNITQDNLAKTMGKSQPAIANKLRLLGLPEEVQDALMKNQISERHARSLLNLKDKEQQLMMLDRIRKERLTVRELDLEIKKLKESPSANQEDNNFNGGEMKMQGNMMNNATSNNFNMSNNQNDSTMSDMPTNNFNQYGTNNQNVMPNYHSNFGGMGLNDYQSSISGNMFNNMPGQGNVQPNINFQNEFTSQFNNPTPNPFESSIPEEQPNNQSDINIISNTSGLNMSNTENMLNKPPQGNNYNSLGSMFDGTSNNPNGNIPVEDYTPGGGDNPFVSQIRENTTQPKQNQFLPNFDTPNNFSNNQTDFNDIPINNSFSNQEQDFGMNNFINQNNFGSNMNDFSTKDNVNTMNNVVGMNNFNNNPINDFSFPEQNPDNNNFSAINFNSNQGSLFNQPLNIVNVPNNMNNFNTPDPPKEEPKFEDNYQESSQEENEKFDNPFDDAYEDILNAKPVSINQEEPKEEEPAESETEEKEKVKTEDTEEVEVIGAEPSNETEDNKEDTTSNSNQEKKNDYIVLDPVKTIFDARGAVYELKKTTDAIKQNNINIDTEEIEFDDYYQITIKIKK